MTTQADYTADEWSLILQSPALAGLCIIQAAPYHPADVARQLGTTLTAITTTAQDWPDTELIQVVVAAILTGQAPRPSRAQPLTLDAARQWVLEGCRQLSTLLAQRAPAAEAEAFARWLLAIGQCVALVPLTAGQPDYRATLAHAPMRLTLEKLAAALDVPVGAGGHAGRGCPPLPSLTR